jgi:IcmF-related N-terminal domain
VQLFEQVIYAIAKPIRIFYSGILRAMPFLRLYASLSLPWRVALGLLIFLLIIWSAAAIRQFLLVGGVAPFYVSNGLLISLMLVLAAPILAFWLVKLGKIKESAGFSDIDQAWGEGLAELSRNGLSLCDTPLFLVLGVEDTERCLQIASATEIDFQVKAPAKKEAALTFCGNKEGVFLFLPSCSGASRLSTVRRGQTQTPVPSINRRLESRPDSLTKTLQSGVLDETSPADFVKTMLDSGFRSPIDLANTDDPIEKTMQLADNDIAHVLKINQELKSTSASTKGLTSEEVADCQERLEYVCKLITQEKRSNRPINGILSAIPYELVDDSTGQLVPALQKDLRILREKLQIRCSNTLLLTGFEREVGFLELIAEVGSQSAREHRFGKGCNLWAIPEPVMLRAVAAHAIGAFEDWVYMLFQSESSLKRRDNSKLFSLMCKVRGAFSDNLSTLLSEGFAHKSADSKPTGIEQFLFAGCYFAATGVKSTQQAFVRSVFLKAMQQKDELEWAPAAQRSETQLQLVANLVAILGVLVLVGMAAAIMWQFFAQ